VALPSGPALFDHDGNGNVTHRTEPGSGLTQLDYDIDNLPRTIRRGALRSEFHEGPGGRWLQRLSTGTSVRETWMLEKTYEQERLGSSATTSPAACC